MPETAAPWTAELDALRAIALDCGLSETVKWRQPCFTADGRNIVILGIRKDHCVLSFFRGALLSDPAGLLQDAGPNTRSAKVLTFTSTDEIAAQAPAIRAFIAEAVTVAAEGRRLPPRPDTIELVDEIEEQLDADPALRTAFEALTPGRQRAWNLLVGGAKRSETRTRRFTKAVPRILAGKGPNDCICGKTRRPPGCDGSHKHA